MAGTPAGHPDPRPRGPHPGHFRRPFEALAFGLVLAYMTAVGALLIASPRRELVVLPLLTALAGACVAEGVRLGRARFSPRG